MAENVLPNHDSAHFNSHSADAQRFESSEPTLQDVNRETTEKQGLGAQHKGQRYIARRDGNMSIPDPVGNRVAHPRYAHESGIGYQTANIGADPLISTRYAPFPHTERINPVRRNVPVLPEFLSDTLFLSPNHPVNADSPHFALNTQPTPTETLDQPNPLNTSSSQNTDQAEKDTEDEQKKKKRKLLPWFLLPFLPIIPAVAISLSRNCNSGENNPNHPTVTVPSAFQTRTPDTITPEPSKKTPIPTATVPGISETPTNTSTPPIETATVAVTKTPTRPAVDVTPNELPKMGTGGCIGSHTNCTH